MLPTLRKRLKTISDGNKGLQDILQSMQKGTEILSVESYNGKVHNTKITLQVDLGEGYPKEQRYQTRVHFYNRVPLNKVIPANAIYPKTTVEDAIEVLNFQYGCDFTEDDVEFIGNDLSAKEKSLGYYNEEVIDDECTNIVNLNWYEETDVGNTAAYYFQDWVADLHTPLVKAGQKWYFGNGEGSGSLLHSSSFISNSLYQRYIDPYNEMSGDNVSKIINIENEHFQLKFIYVFKDDGIYDEERQILVDGFTKSGSFRKLLLGPHQTNNSVTVDSYPLEQLWVRYPELQSGDYLEAVQSSIFDQDFDGRFLQYEPIPGQDALVIEVNILYCPNPNCNPTSLTMQRFNSFIPETHQNGALTIQVVQNGSTITEIIRPSQVQLQGIAITIINMIRWFAEEQGIVFAYGGGGFGQYRTYDRQITGSTNGGGDDGLTPPGPNGPILLSPNGPILLSPNGLTPPGPSALNPTSISIMKTQGEPVETDIFEWLLEAEEGLDAETLAEARSLGLSVRSCGTRYWKGL